MANRNQVWKMSPGEVLPLSVDLSGDMDDGTTISSPSVTVYTRTGKKPYTYTDVTSSLSFAVANEAINTAAITRADGGTTAIGDGVSFMLTASTTQGEYYVVVQATGSDGSTPKTERKLIVAGGA